MCIVCGICSMIHQVVRIPAFWRCLCCASSLIFWVLQEQPSSYSQRRHLYASSISTPVVGRFPSHHSMTWWAYAFVVPSLYSNVCDPRTRFPFWVRYSWDQKRKEGRGRFSWLNLYRVVKAQFEPVPIISWISLVNGGTCYSKIVILDYRVKSH